MVPFYNVDEKNFVCQFIWCKLHDHELNQLRVYKHTPLVKRHLLNHIYKTCQTVRVSHIMKIGLV